MRPGEVWLADLGGEIRAEVLVISDARANRLTEHALVVPLLADVGVELPWRVADEATPANSWSVELAAGVHSELLTEQVRNVRPEVVGAIRAILLRHLG